MAKHKSIARSRCFWKSLNKLNSLDGFQQKTFWMGFRSCRIGGGCPDMSLQVRQNPFLSAKPSAQSSTSSRLRASSTGHGLSVLTSVVSELLQTSPGLMRITSPTSFSGQLDNVARPQCNCQSQAVEACKVQQRFAQEHALGCMRDVVERQ